MLRIPGDFTAPSRSALAVASRQSVLPSQTGDDAVLEEFHILTNFDIPKGAAREQEKDAHGNIVADCTLWTSAKDFKRKRFYFRAHDNSQIRMGDLTKMNLNAKDVVTISLTGGEVIQSVTP